MACANGHLIPHNKERVASPPARRLSNMYLSSSRHADILPGQCDVRGNHRHPLTATSLGHTRSSVSPAAYTPPMPSRPLRCLSFCVAFLSVFTVHLHEASLMLLISRSSPQAPLFDRTVEASEKVVCPPGTPFLRSANGAGGDVSTQPAISARWLSQASILKRQLSAARSPAPPLPLTLRQPPPPPPGAAPTSAGTLDHVLQFNSTEQPGAALESFYATTLDIVAAGKAYAHQTITNVLSGPSPLPPGVPFAGDVLIAWHLLFQTIGCVLCGAAADAKGRRWVLSHAIKVLASSSLVFTLVALTTARLLGPSVEESGVDLSATVTKSTHFVDELSFFDKNSVIPSECPGSSSSDCQNLGRENTTLPFSAYLPGWLSSTRELADIFHHFSTHSLWTGLSYILIFLSLMSYSLAALACGGAAVVAQCLCLEATAPFPLRPPKGDSGHRSHTAEALGHVKDSLPAVCGSTACDEINGVNKEVRMGSTAAAAHITLSGDMSTSAAANRLVAEASADPGHQSLRLAELHSPLLSERGSPPTFWEARNVCLPLDALSNSFRNVSAGIYSTCHTIIHWGLSFARKGCESVYKASELPFFYSSPYVPVAYLVGIQSAAHLFLPAALSTMLEVVFVLPPCGSDATSSTGKHIPRPFTRFALFCVAFSTPILPFCLLLCILTRSRFLKENPYFLFQRRILLRKLSEINSLRSEAIRRIASNTSTARRPADTTSRKSPPALQLCRRKRSLPECTGTPNGMPCPFSHLSSLSRRTLRERQDSTSSLELPRKTLLEEGATHSPPIRGRRRAHSCSDLDNWIPSDHHTLPRVAATAHPAVSEPPVTAGRAKATSRTASVLSLRPTVFICGRRRGAHRPSQPVQEIALYPRRALSNVQLTSSAIATARRSATDQVGTRRPQEELVAEARTLTPSQPERGECADLAPCSGVFSAALKSLHVYHSYLECNYSTSLLGLVLPASFIGASLYLRGVFRFLLLDCVVLEQEAESREASSVPARNSAFNSVSPDKVGVVPVVPLVTSQITPRTAHTQVPSFPSTSSSVTAPPAFLTGTKPFAQGISAELLLFRLSIPVLLVRGCTCVIPVLLLSTLPPKPLQMLGCILCGFLSFGIAVTLEALTQNFPDIPPISSASAASLLYEIVFCLCCSIPAFTSILLPMQGFHTGVRCGFAAAVSACFRAAAAISLVGLSVVLSAFSGNQSPEPSGASKSSVDLSSLSRPGMSGASSAERPAVLEGDFRSAAGSVTTSSDWCSANAALIAVTTCVFYVMAAAFTLLYTTHVRLPRKQVTSAIKRFCRKTDPETLEVRKRVRHVCVARELRLLPPEQHRTAQSTDNVLASTLVAVDNVFLQKLCLSLSGISESEDHAS